MAFLFLLLSAGLPAQPFTEFPLPEGVHPGALCVGPDGAFWFTEYWNDRIGRMDLRGTVTLYPLQRAGARPVDIVAGPDGNLWFTEDGGNAIGRISPQGHVTEFSLATPHSRPWEITSGPDGALWFTEIGPGRIGRIATNGEITEFAADPLLSRGAIVAGPDEGLWFTAVEASPPEWWIGRMTTAGRVEKIRIPTPGAAPVDITAGPDGNMWFTEGLRGRIARITADGSVSEYLIPTPSNEPTSISPGPDGNVWALETKTLITVPGPPPMPPPPTYYRNLLRVSSEGEITAFPIPAPNSEPGALLLGPDGALWFTAVGKIWRFLPPAAIERTPRERPQPRSLPPRRD
jgi:virginiamycin B lyase